MSLNKLKMIKEKIIKKFNLFFHINQIYILIQQSILKRNLNNLNSSNGSLYKNKPKIN